MLYNAAPVAHNGTLSADTNQTGSECGASRSPPPAIRAWRTSSIGSRSTPEVRWDGHLQVVARECFGGHADYQHERRGITVSSLGPDANLGFQNNQWVELTDDTYTYAQPTDSPGLAGKPAQLVQIQSVNFATLRSRCLPITGIDINDNPRMRRWDQSGVGNCGGWQPR